jgi:hypothetical protein
MFGGFQLLVTGNLEQATILSLPLLEARILFIDHIQLALSANNLAICTSFFY